jgi:hypothetical protein
VGVPKTNRTIDVPKNVDAILAAIGLRRTVDGAGRPRTGRPRTGSLYLTKSGWRARITVTADGENAQRSLDLGTHSRIEADIKLSKLLTDTDCPESEAHHVVREVSLLDLAAETNRDPLELSLAIAIRAATECSQWDIVSSLVNALRHMVRTRAKEGENDD